MSTAERAMSGPRIAAVAARPGSAAGRAAAVHAFILLLITLFFLQDVVNLAAIHAGLQGLVPYVSGAKEALIVAFLAFYLCANAGRLAFDARTVVIALLLAVFFAAYAALGLTRYPAVGVLFELRTLSMPLALVVVGWMYGDAVRAEPERAEALVRFYVAACVLVAVSALFDYAYLSDEFWTTVNLGELERIKGYEVTSGALPDNMYSFYFGRRAFGLAFNALNLAYLVLPALVIAWCRRRWLVFVLLAVAMLLTWSRQPIVAVAVVLAVSALPPLAAVAAGFLAVPVIAWYLQAAYLELLNDPHALGHFTTVAIGLGGIIASPLGSGIGAAGIFASAYSTLSTESALLNVANQMGLPGLALYAAAFVFFLRPHGPLDREIRLTGAAYAITAVLSPHIFTIKSTFAFFLLLGVNLALAPRTAPMRGQALVPRAATPGALSA